MIHITVDGKKPSKKKLKKIQKEYNKCDRAGDPFVTGVGVYIEVINEWENT